MKAIIVGGGVGGLTAALMLHARGIDCEVYEQAEAVRVQHERGGESAYPAAHDDRFHERRPCCPLLPELCDAAAGGATAARAYGLATGVPRAQRSAKRCAADPGSTFVAPGPRVSTAALRAAVHPGNVDRERASLSRSLSA